LEVSNIGKVTRSKIVFFHYNAEHVGQCVDQL
jgi:hypothetical protein